MQRRSYYLLFFFFNFFTQLSRNVIGSSPKNIEPLSMVQLSMEIQSGSCGEKPARRYNLFLRHRADSCRRSAESRGREDDSSVNIIPRWRSSDILYGRPRHGSSPSVVYPKGRHVVPSYKFSGRPNLDVIDHYRGVNQTPPPREPVTNAWFPVSRIIREPRIPGRNHRRVWFYCYIRDVYLSKLLFLRRF